jgi:hypothetical protein
MQPTEAEGQLFIFVLDETYDTDDEESYPQRSEAFRAALEAEFGLPTLEANIGPGADVPAFIVDLLNGTSPNWLLLLGLFFAGKPIKENVSAWIDGVKAIRSFFGRRVVLGRHGASVLAIEAVFNEVGGIPKTVRMLSYRTWHDPDPTKYNLSNTIEKNAPILNMSQVVHVFEIEADGQLLRVTVDGMLTRLTRLK